LNEGSNQVQGKTIQGGDKIHNTVLVSAFYESRYYINNTIYPHDVFLKNCTVTTTVLFGPKNRLYLIHSDYVDAALINLGFVVCQQGT